MHCYVCVTYLMIIATAHPPKHRDAAKPIEKRSIFNDVIQSLRIRSQLSEDINLNDENNIGQIDDRFGYDDEPIRLPSDVEFTPRRNDRIEMPTLKYRFPKSLALNNTKENVETSKKEVVLYISTPNDFLDDKTTTQKPNKQKRPRPTVYKNKIAIQSADETETDIETSNRPFMNTMTGQSHIGNRESQTIVKPTVIVNFGAPVMDSESDTKPEIRKSKNDTSKPNTVFNIKQEINLESNNPPSGFGDIKKVRPKVNQNVKVVSNNEKARIEEDMMMCETASWKEREGTKNHPNRKHDVLQILVSL